MLPKVIHYCWFGGSEMPEVYKNIVVNWEALHPAWTIKRWDESNAPLSIPYIEKAKEHNNWANISNYVRFYALGREGGIYLDTDMKVLQPLDKLLSHDCFLGFESGNNGSFDFWVNNAIMGAVANHPFVTECEQRLLEQFDGTEQANLSSPQLVTAILKANYGLKTYGRQLLGDIMLYEREVFYPIPVDKAYLLKETTTYPEETIAVHMWGRTWFTSEMLIEEMDNLRRYTHELSAFNENQTKQLKHSEDKLKITNSKLEKVQRENAALKIIITDLLQKIETSQSTLREISIETTRRLDELTDRVKNTRTKPEKLNQQQGKTKKRSKKPDHEGS